MLWMRPPTPEVLGSRTTQLSPPALVTALQVPSQAWAVGDVRILRVEVDLAAVAVVGVRPGRATGRDRGPVALAAAEDDVGVVGILGDAVELDGVQVAVVVVPGVRAGVEAPDAAVSAD